MEYKGYLICHLVDHYVITLNGDFNVNHGNIEISSKNIDK